MSLALRLDELYIIERLECNWVRGYRPSVSQSIEIKLFSCLGSVRDLILSALFVHLCFVTFWRAPVPVYSDYRVNVYF